MITADTSIEDLVGLCPESVGFLRKRNIACIVCGEVVWGTLGDLLATRGLHEQEVADLVRELQMTCQPEH